MKAALSCAIWAAIGATFLLAVSTIGAESRPNVLLITADDLGCELGCYGDQTPTTPNLNALARDGVRFDRAYVTSASCSPSRSSIFTGKYPHENGHFDPYRAASVWGATFDTMRFMSRSERWPKIEGEAS